MKKQEIRRNVNNSQELTATEVLKFIKMTAPLVEKCYQLLAKDYPCEFTEDNDEFLESLSENFVKVPNWIEDEIDCGDILFKFELDDVTGEVSLEPANENDFCYLPECVLQRLYDEEIDLSDFRDAVDFVVNYTD
ncbi:MAG: hypothetical protein R3Y35_14795 [Clostridia bacterium]